MKTTKKALLFTFCAVLLVVASVLGTMAYLTSSETVTNTFTVGKVGLILDETDYDESKTNETTPGRDKENTYHLLPGHEYTKDPTVTVLKDSEKSYVRMIATITYNESADSVFGTVNSPESIANWLDIKTNDWKITGEPQTTKEDGKITRSYEFRYKNVLDKVTDENGLSLSPLFTKITVPGEITNDQLKELADLKIDVEAHAIQADGFQSKDGKTAEQVAWEAFDQQVNNSQGATENH